MKFYTDISNINCKYLLEATPFRIDPKVNFSHQLDEETFFGYLFQEADKGSNYKENELFERKISDAIEDIGNNYAKVEMIHIAGYGGCGKTTYVRHLLWKLNKNGGLTNEVLDYEGLKTAVEPLLIRVSKRILAYNSLRFRQFIRCVAREEIINMNRFRKHLQQILEIPNFFENQSDINEYAVKNYIKQQLELFGDEEAFLEYLFTLDFVMLIYSQFLNETKKPFIILIDNVDSLSDLYEESMLVSAIKEFVTNCNFFFGQNLDCSGVFEGKSIKTLIENTKLVFFLTTRIATIKRYNELYPDLENLYGWNSAVMPEHYYNHRKIINKRIEYYLKQEKDFESRKKGELLLIRKMAEIAYANYNFKRLFNGNIRFCIERLCDLVAHYHGAGIIEQCIDLFEMRNKIPEASAGANGMILSMILAEFKNYGVYRDKLQLSECRQDDEVSLSRMILTVLREKGGRCSMLELFDLLSPFFKIDDISNETWLLNEMSREIWRRLVLFNVKFPTSSIELRNQAQAYKDKNFEITEYSEVDMCTCGMAYIDFVVPHFEFMLSRHNYSVELLDKDKLQPLFSDSSEALINIGEFKYRFEKKINWVYQDVKDCCLNSVHFSEQVCQYYKISREDYINNTVYNYLSHASDGTARFKQSYESRLIFSHIGYIERYRRFLLKKNVSNGDEYLRDINERLIRHIKKYLQLYADENICYQTSVQNEAVRELNEAIRKIENSNYRDYVTLIETRGESSVHM